MSPRKTAIRATLTGKREGHIDWFVLRLYLLVVICSLSSYPLIFYYSIFLIYLPLLYLVSLSQSGVPELLTSQGWTCGRQSHDRIITWTGFPPDHRLPCRPGHKVSRRA